MDKTPVLNSGSKVTDTLLSEYAADMKEILIEQRPGGLSIQAGNISQDETKKATISLLERALKALKSKQGTTYKNEVVFQNEAGV